MKLIVSFMLLLQFSRHVPAGDDMRADLGVDGMGPGVRPLGRVEHLQPVISAEGKVRADMVGTIAEFP